MNQDFLDTIDLKTQADYEKYKQRQMFVEHPFGTIKHIWDAGYFLTRGKESVAAEVALSYLAYNLKRTISTLGVEEMIQRLKEKGETCTGIMASSLSACDCYRLIRD